MTVESDLRILLWDIETAPIQGAAWTPWDTNLLPGYTPSHLLSVAWKWLGDRRVQCVGLPDFTGYAKRPTDDKALTQHIRDLLDEADITVAHNGVAFDTKKAMARIAVHQIKPPSLFKDVDTLRLARRHFKFDSNKLDDLARFLGIGSKLPNGGYATWEGCLSGDPRAWALMKRYNRHDVTILEQIYLRLRPFANPNTHPNLATMADRPKACPKCGNEAGMIVRKHVYTAVSRRIQYQCKSCNGYSVGRNLERTDTKFVLASG